MLSEKGCASPVPQFAHSVKWVHEVSYRVWGNVPTPECWWLLVTSLELGGGEGVNLISPCLWHALGMSPEEQHILGVPWFRFAPFP